jgi:hypothetical protein
MKWLWPFASPPKPGDDPVDPRDASRAEERFRSAVQRWTSTREDWPELAPDLDFAVRLLGSGPGEHGGVAARLAVAAHAPRVSAAPILEFANGVGGTLDEALDNAIASWCATDLPVFADALREDPAECRLMTKDQADGSPVRIVLGPLRYWSAEGAAPCCDVCLFTALLKSDPALFDAREPTAIKAFVTRDAKGAVCADLRVNALDSERHRAAMEDWARSWDGAGFAARKQFMLVGAPAPSATRPG